MADFGLLRFELEICVVAAERQEAIADFGLVDVFDVAKLTRSLKISDV